MFLNEYASLLKTSINEIVLLNRQGSPYHILGSEILQMIRSYLQDSEFFFNNGDMVNQYASLVYAHGWMNAGAYLGLYDLSGDSISYTDILLEEQYDRDHMYEKTNRYYTMLGTALQSVSGFPGHGSPLAKASDTCIMQAKNELIQGKKLLQDNFYIPALAHFCFGYGWLDTAVRAGLLQVHAHYDLFTTEFI
ncbi:MAG TPA: DUF357 domain-containing protein [Methanospirillum sp.]|nr:DUF357 domain-containing protein [Methanospirillum sp.]